MANKHWLWLLPVLLVTTCLGARRLNADAIWLDEVWSIYNAGGAHFGPLSPWDIWTRNATEDPRNAVGYHLALAGWGALVGWSAFAIRASSLLCGVLAVAWTYRLGRDLASPLAGFSAAVILGTSAFYVFYLHELRAYVLSALLTAMTVWAYWRLITTQKRPAILLQVGFVLGLAGLLYTHYFTVMVIGAIGLYHLQFVRKTSRWWRVIILMGIAGLLFLPWFSALLGGLELTTNDTILHHRSMDAAQILSNLAYYFSNGVGALLAITLALALTALKAKGARAAWFIAIVTLALLLVANLRLQVIAPGRERYMLMLWPLLAVVSGIGVWQIVGTRMRYVGLVLVGLWGVIGINTSLGTEFTRDVAGSQPMPWDALARELAERVGPGDVLAVHTPADNWVLEITTADYHLHGLPVRFSLIEEFPGISDEAFQQAAREFVDSAPEVWLGVDKRQPPRGQLADFEQAIADEYIPCGTVFDVPLMSLSLYLHIPPEIASNPIDSAVMRFGDGVALAYHDPLPTQVEGRLDTIFIWSVGPDVPPYTYSVALHVTDANGQFVAQQDYGLPMEALACRKTSISVSDLAPGEYTLMTIVYRWENGERLPGIIAATGEEGDRLPVGTFTVGD
ncbi:MAG: glycosyltransferase family 39 protein [Candidatus Methanoperedens sp.]|nr:glycosyltransferase family 39 protein [Candidatus Methanoperedens sp.]